MNPKKFMSLKNQCVCGWPGNEKKHFPVAFIRSMQFWRVYEMLPRLKVYKPKKK